MPIIKKPGSTGGGGGGGANTLAQLNDVEPSLEYTDGFVFQANGSKYFGAVLPHTDLSDIGVNTHPEIDDHIADHANPHVVTVGQIGAVATTGDETISGVKTFSSFPVAAGMPTTSQQLVNKSYADSLASGFKFKDSCKAATTTVLAAVTYNNGASGVGATLTANANGALGSIDDYAVQLNDRLLIKDQASGAQNGIYSATALGDGSNPFILTRTTDFDTAAEMTEGSATLITNGTANGATQWALSATVATVGTTAATFIQISSPAVYLAGDGLDLVTNTFSVDLKANDGLAIKSTELGVDYDDSSIGIVSTKLAVKSAGITNAMLAGSIADTNLNTISTAGKVSGAALTSLASIPSGAGIVPTANLATGTANSSVFLRGDGTWTSSGLGTGVATINYNKTLLTDTTAVTVTNTAASTAIFTYVIPAATLGTDKMLRVNLRGIYINNSGSNTSLTCTATMVNGATTGTIVNRTVNAAIPSNAVSGGYNFTFTIAATNSTTAQVTSSYLDFKTGGATSFVSDEARTASNMALAQTLTFRVQHGNANNNITLTQQLAIVELVNASDVVGAPTDATYVTLTTSSNLSNERVLTGTANQIVVTDNGAGSTVVLSTPQSIGTGSSPTFTGLTVSGVTASRAVVTNGSSALAAATTTATEIGYVNGVTSAIQTQLNAKAPLASPTFTGTVTTAKFVETPVALTDGATPALDASLGNIFTLTTTTNPTIAVPSNPTSGQKIVIRITASGGSRTAALNTGAGGFRFGTDITGLTAISSGLTDYIGAIYNSGASFWDVVAYSKGY